MACFLIDLIKVKNKKVDGEVLDCKNFPNNYSNHTSTVNFNL